MSLKLVFVLLGLAGVIGIGLGYFIRYLVGLGKRGSIELEIKRKLLEAQEEANKILETADAKAKQELGWEPKTRFADLVKLMVDADIQRVKDHLAGKGKVAD